MKGMRPVILRIANITLADALGNDFLSKTAKASIRNAPGQLDDVSDMTSVSAEGIIRDARLRMEDATLKFSEGDYANATIEANVVSALVAEAGEDEASYRIMLARNKIASAGEPESPDARSMLANASRMYDRSEEELASGHYEDAIVYAGSAMGLAADASAAEQRWRDGDPLNAVAPGSGPVAAVLALAAILIIKERKD